MIKAITVTISIILKIGYVSINIRGTILAKIITSIYQS